MIGQIYPTEFQLNKANSSDTEAPYLDLNLSITNGIVSSKIYDKRDDFKFEIVNFMVYIFLSLFVLQVDDFNNRHLSLIAKLLKQGYRYH